jgi:hypothetical protein
MTSENLIDQFYQSYIGTVRSADPIKKLAYAIDNVNLDSGAFQTIYNTELYQTTINYWHNVKYKSEDNYLFTTLDDVYEYMTQLQNLESIIHVLQSISE